MCVCVLHVCMLGRVMHIHVSKADQRRMLDGMVYHFLLSFCELGSLTEPGARLGANKPSTALGLYAQEQPGLAFHTGFELRVLMLAELVLFPTEPPLHFPRVLISSG